MLLQVCGCTDFGPKTCLDHRQHRLLAVVRTQHVHDKLVQPSTLDCGKCQLLIGIKNAEVASFVLKLVDKLVSSLAILAILRGEKLATAHSA